MKHTQKKWSYYEKSHTKGGGYFHIDIGKTELTGFMGKANARLIASAPELLEACKKNIARLKKLIEPNMLERTIIEDLEQAIKKAIE